MTAISILICTKDRCARLKETLQSLLRQEDTDHFNFEILVVDNGSRDHTKELVHSFMPQFKKRLRYLYEEKRGKPFAINTGIRHAKGDIIAFLDDDCLAETHYLSRIYAGFKNYESEISFAGGKIIPKWLGGERPAWLKDYFLRPLALLDYGSEHLVIDRRDLKDRKLFYGANFAFKREIFKKHGLFNTQRTFTQDVEFCERILLGGEKGLYCPDVVVTHQIPQGRMRKKYFYYWFYQRGRMKSQEVEDKFYYPLGVPRWLLKRFITAFLKLGRKSDEFTAVKNKCELLFHLGMINERVKQNII